MNYLSLLLPLPKIVLCVQLPAHVYACRHPRLATPPLLFQSRREFSDANIAHGRNAKSPRPTTHEGSESGGDRGFSSRAWQHRSPARPAPLIEAARPGVAQVASTKEPPQALGDGV